MMGLRQIGSGLVIAAVLAAFAPARASAAVVEADDPEKMVPVVIGSLGGVASSVAAIVYALEDRAFDDAWIVTSLFSSAVCTAMMVGFLVNAENDTGVGTAFGVIGFAALAGWPLYWTIRTAASDVDPGERFESPARAAIDPFRALEPRSSGSSPRALVITAFAFEL